MYDIVNNIIKYGIKYFDLILLVGCFNGLSTSFQRAGNTSSTLANYTLTSTVSRR